MAWNIFKEIDEDLIKDYRVFNGNKTEEEIMEEYRKSKYCRWYKFKAWLHNKGKIIYKLTDKEIL